MTDQQINKLVSGYFVSTLTIALIVLKLTELADISWWWAFSPVLIQTGVVLAVPVVLCRIMDCRRYYRTCANHNAHVAP